MIKNRIGLIVKVMFTNGHILMGAIREWEKGFILLASTNGEIIEIVNPSRDITAVIYIAKSDGNLLEERSKEDVEPRHKPGDIQGMTEIAKLRAETDRESIRAQLLSPTCAAGEIEHDSQLSILSGVKDDSGR